jgi:hypothetical protein
MALSDHEQVVLREMEVALRADTTRSTTTRRSATRASRQRLAAAIGFVLAGIIATAVGLRLGDRLGTALGVLGFLLIVSSCWIAISARPTQRGAT